MPTPITSSSRAGASAAPRGGVLGRADAHSSSWELARERGRTQQAANAASRTSVEAWSIVNRFIAALVLYGGGGWLLGWWLGSVTIGLAIGTLVGVVLATYLSVARVSALDVEELPTEQMTHMTTWAGRMALIRRRNARETTR